jgi:hypothetical protein
MLNPSPGAVAVFVAADSLSDNGAVTATCTLINEGKHWAMGIVNCNK